MTNPDEDRIDGLRANSCESADDLECAQNEAEEVASDGVQAGSIRRCARRDCGLSPQYEMFTESPILHEDPIQWRLCEEHAHIAVEEFEGTTNILSSREIQSSHRQTKFCIDGGAARVPDGAQENGVDRGTDLVGGLPWNSDHPCFNGHNTAESLDECSRCGAELKRNPNGRWRPLDEYGTEGTSQSNGGAEEP